MNRRRMSCVDTTTTRKWRKCRRRPAILRGIFVASSIQATLSEAKSSSISLAEPSKTSMRRRTQKSISPLPIADRDDMPTTHDMKQRGTSEELVDITPTNFFRQPYITRVSTRCPDTDYVTGPLHQADADGNGVLNQEEYVTFADAVSGGYLTDIDKADNFLDMPLGLQETYVVLSCLCELYEDEPWGGEGCCTVDPNSSNDNIGIRTDGTAPGDDMTDVQLSYVTYVCGTMSESLESVGGELVAPPTSTPTKSPTVEPSKSPTSTPTKTPTFKPTQTPTISPSENPTTSPTNRPTLVPTENPSKTPTGKPTNNPTNIPTDIPTDIPTRAPTNDPSRKPTNTPTGTPTNDPTRKPTNTPTGAPTNDPTGPFVPTSSPEPTTETKPPSFSIPPSTSLPTSTSPVSPTSSPAPTTETKSPSISIPPSASLPTSASPISPTSSPAPTTETKSPSFSIPPSTSMPTSASPISPTSSPAPTTETKLPSFSVPPSTSLPTSASPISPTLSPVPTTETKSPSFSISPSTSMPTSASPISPTLSPVPTTETKSPSISSAPTIIFPTSSPVRQTFPPDPTSSTPPSLPTVSPHPTDNPVYVPTASPIIGGGENNTFTGTVPVTIEFVESIEGKATADEVMEGTTNQVKVMLEAELLKLSEIVIAENFGAERRVKVGLRVKKASFSNPHNSHNSNLIRRRRLEVEASKAEIDSIRDVECPDGLPSGAAPGSDCLDFNATITLSLENQPDKDGTIQTFNDAMNDAIAAGKLYENFDLEEALKPPPPSAGPSPTPLPPNEGGGSNEQITSEGLSTGAIVGIVLAAMLFLYGCLLSLLYARKRRDTRKDDEPYELERREVTNSSVMEDGMNPPPSLRISASPDKDSDTGVLGDSWSSDSSEANTEANNSQNMLLRKSRAATSSSAMANPALGTLDDESELSEVDLESWHDSEEATPRGDMGSSPLAAVAMASTLVASTTAQSADTSSHTPTSDMAGQARATTVGATPVASSDLGATPAGQADARTAEFGAAAVSPSSAGRTEDTSRGSASPFGVPAAGAGNDGISAGAAAAIGATGAITAGAMAAGAYAATRSPKKDENSNSLQRKPIDAGFSARKRGTGSSSNLDELDNAIEAGNWGAVGALAAILASEGRSAGIPSLEKKMRSVSSVKSGSLGSSGSRGSSTGPSTLDQTRAAEIDKLVEAGDWQGVVLAAARFEADQTMDGESYSASASQSSRWTGSATSATTPRSMATTEQSSTIISSGRSQAEIRAEVEALVRRVVPEEADNVDEMLTQFKGREEELVETLRRMQERAIASRARLAVQKSAKLEARARAASPAPMREDSITSGYGRGSISIGSLGTMESNTTKSELEQAIEAGNWQAVGEAAKKMSDRSVGSLSIEEKARLKEAISHSPGLSSRGSSQEEFNLDILIEKGDWPGVIAAAKKASEEGDRNYKSSITKEEQEALAQANMWQEIAEQTKQEGRQDPAGAGDAAAWAIQRSLHALNTPEAKDAQVRTIQDIADEDSSSAASQYESSSYSHSASKSHGHSEDHKYYRRGI